MLFMLFLCFYVINQTFLILKYWVCIDYDMDIKYNYLNILITIKLMSGSILKVLDVFSKDTKVNS